MKKFVLTGMLAFGFALVTLAQSSGFKSVADIDSYIQAVEVKIEYVKNDPEQKKIALENGWFEQMEKNIAEAKEQRAALLAKEEDK